MLVSLTALGYLRIEDDRGMGIVYGAEVKSINFLNGARHSVYYKRNGPNALLLVNIYQTEFTWNIPTISKQQVDKEEVPLRPLSTSIHPDGLADVTGNTFSS